MPLRRAALLLALAATLAGCDDATGPSTPSGTVRFTLSGDRAGTFAAAGGYPGPDRAATRSWSFAADYRTVFGTPEPLWAISASQHRGGAVSDVFSLSLEGVAAGATYACDAATVASGGCAFLGGFGVGNDRSRDDDPPLEAEYAVVSGSVTVAETGARLRGTFRLTLREERTGAALEIADGTFDVPVLPLETVLADRAPDMR